MLGFFQGPLTNMQNIFEGNSPRCITFSRATLSMWSSMHFRAHCTKIIKLYFRWPLPRLKIFCSRATTWTQKYFQGPLTFHSALPIIKTNSLLTKCSLKSLCRKNPWVFIILAPRPYPCYPQYKPWFNWPHFLGILTFALSQSEIWEVSGGTQLPRANHPPFTCIGGGRRLQSLISLTTSLLSHLHITETN